MSLATCLSCRAPTLYVNNRAKKKWGNRKLPIISRSALREARHPMQCNIIMSNPRLYTSKFVIRSLNGHYRWRAGPFVGCQDVKHAYRWSFDTGCLPSVLRLDCLAANENGHQSISTWLFKHQPMCPSLNMATQVKQSK